MSAITKEYAAEVAARLQAVGDKISATSGLVATHDVEVEAKDAYFAVTLYFTNEEQEKAINKAKNAIAKAIANGTFGQEEAPAKPAKKVVGAKPAAAAEPATAIAMMKSSTAKAIVAALAEYDLTTTVEAVKPLTKIDTKLTRAINKVFLQPLELVDEVTEAGISPLVAALVYMQFETDDPVVSKAMARALKKMPELEPATTEEPAAEEPINDDDILEEPAPKKGKGKALELELDED